MVCLETVHHLLYMNFLIFPISCSSDISVWFLLQNWNTFLRNITRFDLCIANDSLTDHQNKVNSVSYDVEESTKQNVSLQLPLHIHISHPIPSNISFSSLKISLDGFSVGYSGVKMCYSAMAKRLDI